MTDYVFLLSSHVIALHSMQISKFGGDPSIRDAALLESACNMPPAYFGDNYLHADIFEMAAAYLYYITKNHPFVDGNKRTGLISALVFLDRNGYEVNTSDDELYYISYAVADGSLNKAEVAEFFRRYADQKS